MNNSYLPVILQAVEGFLNKPQTGFDECIAALRDFSKDTFRALQLNGNPIANDVPNYKVEQIEFVIKEYSCFSNEAIHMLLDAMIRNYDWKDLFIELQNNIDEEKGKETRGIPHLEMMRQGYKIDLGIDTDNILHSEITLLFLKNMKKIFKHNDNAFSAGALIAFEGTAIAEFHILDKIVQEYDKKKHSGNRTLKTLSLTKIYIDGHKDFEIGHEAHLISAIRPYINKGNMDKMVRGYLSVCMCMNTWWEQLAIENFRCTFNSLINAFNTEEFPIDKAFQP